MDEPMGEGRWIQLAPKGAQTSLVLMQPTEDMPAEVRERSRSLIGGFTNFIFAVDDMQATYAELSKRGVEFPDDTVAAAVGLVGDAEGPRRQRHRASPVARYVLFRAPGPDRRRRTASADGGEEIDQVAFGIPKVDGAVAPGHRGWGEHEFSRDTGGLPQAGIFGVDVVDLEFEHYAARLGLREEARTGQLRIGVHRPEAEDARAGRIFGVRAGPAVVRPAAPRDSSRPGA